MGIVADYNNKTEEARKTLLRGIESGLETLTAAGCPEFVIWKGDVPMNDAAFAAAIIDGALILANAVRGRDIALYNYNFSTMMGVMCEPGVVLMDAPSYMNARHGIMARVPPRFDYTKVAIKDLCLDRCGVDRLLEIAGMMDKVLPKYQTRADAAGGQ